VSDLETLALEYLLEVQRGGFNPRANAPSLTALLRKVRDERDERALRIVEESGLGRATRDGLKRRLEEDDE
jgi:hypothetical protein